MTIIPYYKISNVNVSLGNVYKIPCDVGLTRLILGDHFPVWSLNFLSIKSSD
jgi:hypothetical protein